MRFSIVILLLINLLSAPLSAEGLESKGKFLCKELTLVSFSQKIHPLISHKNKLVYLRPSPLFKLFHDKQKRTKKITAAVLAFPFPFGIVGLHRIYLGCPPYVPVVYIGTLGGVFGALPLIDFFVIVFDKNFENYLNNPQVFMWIK